MSTVLLPWPPSLNAIWRSIVINGAPRVLLSKAGRDYREVVSRLLRENGVAIRGPVQVTIDAYPPDRRRRDVDNLAKAALDALTHAGVWGDDSQVLDLRIRMRAPGQRPGLAVVIAALEPELAELAA